MTSPKTRWLASALERVQGRICRSIGTSFSSNGLGRLRFRLACLTNPRRSEFEGRQLRYAFRLMRSQGSQARVLLTGTGVVVLVAKDSVYQVPLTTYAMAEQRKLVDAWHDVRSWRGGVIANLANYWLRDVPEEYGCNAIEAERLVILDHAHVRTAGMSVCNELSRYSALKQLPSRVVDSWRDCVQRIVDIDDQWVWLEWIDTMSSRLIAIGPAHGDLTPRNVMRGQDGFVLIDLSRFSFDGVQIFDKLHYSIELRAKSRIKSWAQILGEAVDCGSWLDFEIPEVSEAVDGISQNESAVLYFLMRASYDGSGEGWSRAWTHRLHQLVCVLTERISSGRQAA